jgi:hypothetical protein
MRPPIMSGLKDIDLPLARLPLARSGRLRRNSDVVRYVRYFCRADEATAMPLDDLLQTSSVSLGLSIT